MKKLILSLFTLLLFVGSISAQEDVMKMVKKANKLLNAYNLDQSNTDKLAEAKTMIDQAMTDPTAMEDIGANQVLGEIYNATLTDQVKKKILDPNLKLTDYTLGATAVKALTKALNGAEKKFQKKDALNTLAEISSSLNQFGLAAFNVKDYKNAYDNFKAVLDIQGLLTSNGMAATLGDEAQMNDQIYLTGFSALNAGDTDAATPYFEKLVAAGFEDARVYSSLYTIKKKKGMEEEALAMLNKGREKYPDDTGLLFEEINYYLGAGKLDVLISKLEVAMEKEPDNVTVITTLGNVHDNLYQKETAAGNSEKAEDHFNKALEFYGKASAKKPDHFDAVYSVGALYYNKGVALSKEMNELANDYSSEGTKKYEAKKVQVLEMFDKSLPHFEKAEGLNKDDRNTLIALKEIYARKDDFTKSNAYKARIEALGN
jgi:tetratricopeptide (TPR) repeat protein